MPIIKSAKKRVKINTKARARNVRTKRTLHEAMKAFSKALTSGKPAEITKAQSKAVSAIDVAAKKAVIHKNKAARQKSQLAAQVKAVVRQSSPSKTSAKPAKSRKSKVESLAKKAPAKKPTAKPTKSPKAKP